MPTRIDLPTVNVTPTPSLSATVTKRVEREGLFVVVQKVVARINCCAAATVELAFKEITKAAPFVPPAISASVF